MASLRAGPGETVHALEEQAKVINAPRLGVADNFAFPTMQLNIACNQGGGDTGKHDVTRFPSTLIRL